MPILLQVVDQSLLGIQIDRSKRRDLSVLERRKRVELKDSEEQKAILEVQMQLEAEERPLQ